MKRPFLLSSHPPQLLLVEDNLIALHLVETIAKQANCKYHSARDAEHGLVLAQSIPFDLIITDIGLPGMSGNEFTYALRQWEKELQKVPVPVVGLTAHTSDDARQQCLRSGMNTVIMKPINLEIMLDLVERYVFSDAEVLYDLSTNQQLSRVDLPDDSLLFSLDHFPLLNSERGIKNMADEASLKKVLQLMVEQAIPEDETELRIAYAFENWPRITKITHKIKSGALYCGMVRMQYACQYLAHYYKSGRVEHLTALYQQLIQVIEQSKKEVKAWLALPNGKTDS